MTVARAPMQDDYLGTAIDFAAPLGEPALLAPDSVQWRVYKNPIALGIGKRATRRFSLKSHNPA